jgi:hypothetical protein
MLAGLVSFRITKGNVRDSKKFSPMIRKVFEQYDIDKVYVSWIRFMVMKGVRNTIPLTKYNFSQAARTRESGSHGNTNQNHRLRRDDSRRGVHYAPA